MPTERVRWDKVDLRQDNWEKVGNNNLRLDASPIGGFHHVALRDADDGDVIVVNEDDIEALRDKLTQILETAKQQAEKGTDNAR